MALYRHDSDFAITVNRQDLMHSRRHESELELARLGCAHLVGRKESRVLVGGLGMGYTLRQALDMVDTDAKVVVGELLSAVVEWNRDFLGELNGQPLKDKRVEVKTCDVVELISHSKNEYDAILLDIDNGPSAVTDSGNDRLYGRKGILACQRALRKGGTLAVWSSESCPVFEKVLLRCNFHVRGFRVSAHKGSKSRTCFIWVASESRSALPPAGKVDTAQRQAMGARKVEPARQ